MSPETELGFLELPPDWEVLLVDDDIKLQHAGCLLEKAYICALDAEWQPDQKPAKATLVQLAIRLQDTSRIVAAGHVILLDMLALTTSRVRDLLQAVLRSKSVLKVGFGLVLDLWAIARAVGSEGLNCVAVVEPQLDLGTLHRQLLKDRLPDVRMVSGAGLSALVEAHLSRPLDKHLQCSSWGSRPLSPSQISYAALDAVCLVLVLDVFMTAAMSHHEEVLDSADALSTSLAGMCITCVPDTASAGLLRHQRSPIEVQVADVAAAWASRLEIASEVRATRPRRRPGKGRIKDVDSDLGWPACIPWREGQAGKSGVPRFVCDVMTEGLARQLRLCGIDVICTRPVLKDQRFKIYRFYGVSLPHRTLPINDWVICAEERKRLYQQLWQLVEQASADGRIILTADLTFIRARYSDFTYWVRGGNKKEQLAEVLAAFDISVTESALLSRCAACNGVFIPRPFGPSELPAECKVPTGVRANVDQFWLCASCGKAYWRGPLFAAAKHHLAERLREPAVQWDATGRPRCGSGRTLPA